ncbi:hypothetical protein ACFCXA_18225 [Streptomyces virginiae]|uniref:hypothetical protein n=1 Tax=Streptomyces virginiae TaxID=1961 RepID=UPI00324AB31D
MRGPALGPGPTEVQDHRVRRLVSPSAMLYAPGAQSAARKDARAGFCTAVRPSRTSGPGNSKPGT